MVTKDILHHPFLERLRRLPKRAYFLAGLAFILIWYAIFFVIPRPLQYSVASKKSCVAQLTLFPSLQQSTTTDHFRATIENRIRIGSFDIVGTSICVTPVASPAQGRYMAASAPLGGWIFRQNLAVEVTTLPVASTATLQKPIPVTKPLSIALSTPDIVNTYTLSAGGDSATCTPNTTGIQCDLPALQLKQGSTYTLKLTKQFQTEAKETVFEKKITTLTATTITDSSVKPGEIVYARPQSFTFTTDKSLKSAKVSVAKSDGTKVEGVATVVDERTITATTSKELDRDTDYTMTISSLEATDGSSLVEPYQVAFHMSGGPRVTGVNIGTSGIGQSAQVVVTFDQALSGTQDISKLAALTGGNATITRSGAQLIYQLTALPLCTPFTLTITKGILSEYDIASTDNWSYTSRTTCHTTSVYGYSVRGRALVAYHFGSSGPVTLYVGAIHGNESSSSGLMKAWINHLEANPALYANKRIVVVPTINPDGVASGTRTNARGVNLNRNFPTSNWVSDINDTDGTHAGGGGSAPLSEPEASALASFTSSLHPRLLLSFHAVGSLVSGDPGGYSAGYASRYASMVGYRDATGEGSSTFDYDITGAYEDWTYSKQGIPSMVIELGSYSYYNFSYHRAALEAMLN